MSDVGDLEPLSKLLDLLRTKGVMKFQGANYQVEFAPFVDASPVPAEKVLPQQDADNCKCGHALYAHVNGLCAMGCDVEKCAPKEGES